jgi:DNA-binding CsgD family transcriptional regulator
MDERGELCSLAARRRQLASGQQTGMPDRRCSISLTNTSVGRWSNRIQIPTTHSLGLTQGQIDCLLLVAQHFTSKEIASSLGISRHTVDQRVRAAIRALGVKRRSEAARIVMHHYQPIFQWSSESPEPFGVPTAAQHAMPPPDSFALPFATRVHTRNEMSIALRLVWIGLIGFGAAASAGVYLAGLESLGRFLANQ